VKNYLLFYGMLYAVRELGDAVREIRAKHEDMGFLKDKPIE
jgi:hypothetical protein